MQIQEPTKNLGKWKKTIISKHIGIGPVGVDNWFFKGLADLYCGVTGAILRTVPNALLYFVVYESMLFSIPNNIKEFWISSLSLLGLSLVSQVSPSQWSNIALTWGGSTS
jgi:ABC-type amino acid transport system permease subunit